MVSAGTAKVEGRRRRWTEGSGPSGNGPLKGTRSTRRTSRLGLRRDFSQSVIQRYLDFHQQPVRKVLVLRIVPTHRRSSHVKRAQRKEPLMEIDADLFQLQAATCRAWLSLTALPTLKLVVVNYERAWQMFVAKEPDKPWYYRFLCDSGRVMIFPTVSHTPAYDASDLQTFLVCYHQHDHFL